MKNPYLFSYLPFVSVLVYSLTFGVYTVGISLDLFREIGLYGGMREFLTDLQLRVFLLIIYALFFFMLFSALKLIGETIHDTAMLLFAKDVDGISYREAKGGRLIYFIGAFATAGGIHSIQIMGVLFLITTFIYFIYVCFKLSKFMTLFSMVGLIFFEILMWGSFLSLVVYILLRLYNGVLASLPFG